MKPNRSQMIIVFMVVLAICTGMLLGGCASTGKGKEGGSETESSGRIDQLSTAVEEKTVSSPEVRKAPVVNAVGAGDKSHVQEASLNADQGRFAHNAAYLMQGLERIFPRKLDEMNWNRIGTVLAGILFMSMIYGLAFGLGRLSARRRGAGRRGAVERPGSIPEYRSPGEPAYRTS